jgi:phenylpropionate dioxygenase-like ring-hydroxylating dioxygenase large terminal subunit
MTIAPSTVFLPTLPGRYYTDPAIFELEKRNIFERQWQYVCRHRGSTLCLTDTGDFGRSIRCPYHAWTYRLDGSLMSAPNWRSMDAADKADFGLHPVHLGEWHGMVWLNLADDPPPLEDLVWPQLDFRLGGDRDRFARYDLAGLVVGRRIDYTVAANWKIIQENFQECYHCSTIHPELVDTVPAFRNLGGGAPVTYDTEGYVFAPDKVSFSASGRAVLPRLPGLEDSDDRKYYGMVMRPNCFLSLLPDHVIAHRFEPVSTEVTKVVCEWLFPPSTVAGYDLPVVPGIHGSSPLTAG